MNNYSKTYNPSAARAAIERLYIAMRHLFIRGSYKPLGVSGEALIDALMTLEPEIYGSIAHSEKIELNGLLYIFKRLPKGIEKARYIKLISREGFEKSFDPIIASARRRNCYRIDDEQVFIEMTRGRSDIYDILTHLTFMFVEAQKILKNAKQSKDKLRREWTMLETIVQKEQRGEDFNKQVAFTYLSTLLGRTFAETTLAYEQFEKSDSVNSLFHIVYWLGKRAIEEEQEQKDREITFSNALRDKIGHHIYGEIWADKIKHFLIENDLIHRPLHIISANTHSVMNTFYGKAALGSGFENLSLEEIAKQLSMAENDHLRQKVKTYASRRGMMQLDDESGMNISVQLFDTEQINWSKVPNEIKFNKEYIDTQKPIVFVMDYAFGEQAFELMDELLKPYDDETKQSLNIKSISIMGKAGILKGDKGDIMLPNAHIFEGTADNYPFENDLCADDFENVPVVEGPMVSVLGTSLQNRDILRFFHDSSWQVIGLEMEGAHYQKAIQAASKIRRSIDKNVKVRYAYYASDNPLVSGQTLASG
ncbi:MAG: hypothetical protein AB8G11_10170, partial [Saprospiraceae bacterium]